MASLNFTDLDLGEPDIPAAKSLIQKKRIDASAITDITKKLSKEQKDELRKIEPGFHVPVLNYKVIGCWCENCNDSTMQVLNEKQTKLRCLTCKKDRVL
jgi:hypothetical protein